MRCEALRMWYINHNHDAISKQKSNPYYLLGVCEGFIRADLDLQREQQRLNEMLAEHERNQQSHVRKAV